jgi:2-polyprenyl-3-methyl-5-hydroxy-6-metoxy-1,4-benzoquinol methylase
MTPVPAAPSIEEVRTFWEGHPCGHETATATDELEYFLGVERFRYADGAFIREAAAFERFADKRVLEIGCGLGTDGAQFAAAGAEYVGVDLTDAAISIARRNFAVRGLAGGFFAADAEKLRFGSATFDHVYSFGVIHHTPNPAAVIDEILRVLKPRGTVTVMLYNRSSINYYVEIMFLRRLGRKLLRPSWSPKILSAALRLSRAKLEGHRQNLLRIPKPTHERWISMNTDGPDCPLARVYSAAEARALFAAFTDVRTEVHHFDRSHWPFVGKIISDELATAIGRRFGWCRMVYGRKPA